VVGARPGSELEPERRLHTTKVQWTLFGRPP
jgi:hypothetical protein